jgi:hypothetical protein
MAMAPVILLKGIRKNIKYEHLSSLGVSLSFHSLRLGFASFITAHKYCSALIQQDTSIKEYNPTIEVLNDKTKKQKLYE